MALLQGTPAPSVLVVVIDTILGVINFEPVIENNAISVKRLKGLVNLELDRKNDESHVIIFITLNVTHSLLGSRRVPCEDVSILIVTK